MIWHSEAKNIIKVDDIFILGFLLMINLKKEEPFQSKSKLHSLIIGLGSEDIDGP